jgi:hypothetical protein
MLSFSTLLRVSRIVFERSCILTDFITVRTENAAYGVCNHRFYLQLKLSIALTLLKTYQLRHSALQCHALNFTQDLDAPNYEACAFKKSTSEEKKRRLGLLILDSSFHFYTRHIKPKPHKEI